MRTRDREDTYKGTTLTVAELIPTVETPRTSVVAYLGDMTVTTAEGTLTCKDTGALATTGDRSVAGVCT